MSRSHAILLATCTCGVLAAGWLEAASQTREPTTSRTALIAGVVTADDSVGAPLRRVRVTLKGPDALTEQTFVTGDDGTFRFLDLTAGRYTLIAAKEAYLATEYRAKQPGRSGMPIVLTPGAQVTDLSIPLLRGSVIAGRILGLNGQPVSNRVVSIVTARVVRGTRTLALVNATGAYMDDLRRVLTDDEGNYRIYGLPPGEYLVAVGMEGFSQWAGNWHVMTAEEMQRAKSGNRQSQPPTVGAGTSQSFSLPITIGLPGMPPSGPINPVQFAPVYYPGTTFASDAGRVTLGRSEERNGIDMRLIMARTASVAGSVLESSGQPAANVVVQILSSEPQVSGIQQSSTVMPLSNGKFFRPGLAPGRYVIEARTLPNNVAGSKRDQAAWAQTEIVVSGQDLTGITLTLQPSASIAGRMTLSDGAAVTAPVQITLTPEMSVEGSWVATRTVSSRGGRFELADVLPGRYRLSAAAAGADSSSAASLFFAGSMVAGRDASDAAFNLTSGQLLSGVAISFTDHPSRLTGALQDIAAQPALDYSVIVFPTEQSWWYWQSRRIRVQHTGSDGGFAIAGLPAGDYALAVVTDIAANEEFDPEYLQALLKQSVRVTMTEGATTVKNLRIGPS
jgi:uncharacterized protein (DUF2141 family)